MPIKLVLADNHPIFINGLVNLFQMEDDIEVIATCANAVEALDAVRIYQPDLALLDIRMPKVSGLELARKIKEENLPTRIVFLAADMSEEQTLEALRLGVQGVLLKDQSPDVIVQAVRKVFSGGQWVEHESAMRALEKMVRRENGLRELRSILTSRELDIVLMVTRGLSNREIANSTCVSEGTVKVHLNNIYRKVKVSGRQALSRHANEKGLL